MWGIATAIITTVIAITAIIITGIMAGTTATTIMAITIIITVITMVAITATNGKRSADGVGRPIACAWIASCRAADAGSVRCRP
jgi:hypothetical protein